MTQESAPSPDLRQVFDDLIRFETLVWAKIDSRLQADSDLSLGSVNLMLIIDATPQCRVLDIAEALAITVGGASQAVDRLETAGLCTRRPHPVDRRSSTIHLTSTGAEFLRRAAPIFDDELARRFQTPLPEAELAHLARALRTLRDAASAPDPEKFSSTP